MLKMVGEDWQQTRGESLDERTENESATYRIHHAFNIEEEEQEEQWNNTTIEL